MRRERSALNANLDKLILEALQARRYRIGMRVCYPLTVSTSRPRHRSLSSCRPRPTLHLPEITGGKFSLSAGGQQPHVLDVIT